MKHVSLIAGAMFALSLAAPARADGPPVLPDLNLTPGAYLQSCTIKDICPHERAGLRGVISASLRKSILRNYDATQYCAKPGACEFDHSIPVELCGATVADNIWAQSYLYPEGAHMKDWLENRLHQIVCSGALSLPVAREKIRSNWLGAFVEYGGPELYTPAKPPAPGAVLDVLGE